MDNRKLIILETDKEVDIAVNQTQANHWINRGWRVVSEHPDSNWDTVANLANDYARDHRKYCSEPRPLTEEQKSDLLARVYRLILSWPDKRDDKE